MNRKLISLFLLLTIVLIFGCISQTENIEEHKYKVIAIEKKITYLIVFTDDGHNYNVYYRDLELFTDTKTMEEAYVIIPFLDGDIYTGDHTKCLGYAELHIHYDVWNERPIPVDQGSCLGTLFIALLILGGASVKRKKNIGGTKE